MNDCAAPAIGKVSGEAGLFLEIKRSAEQTKQGGNQDVNGGVKHCGGHWDSLSVWMRQRGQPGREPERSESTMTRADVTGPAETLASECSGPIHRALPVQDSEGRKHGGATLSISFYPSWLRAKATSSVWTITPSTRAGNKVRRARELPASWICCTLKRQGGGTEDGLLLHFKERKGFVINPSNITLPSQCCTAIQAKRAEHWTRSFPNRLIPETSLDRRHSCTINTLNID